MVTTGIIKEINISEETSDIKNNKYKVFLPIFNTPDNTNEDGCTMDCTASVIGGIYSPYDVGDMVYVSFVNNEFQSPVIIGKIYKGNTEEIRSYAKLDSLYVNSTATLPKNTTIGNISYIQLNKAIKKIREISAGTSGGGTKLYRHKVSILDPDFQPIQNCFVYIVSNSITLGESDYLTFKSAISMIVDNPLTGDTEYVKWQGNFLTGTGLVFGLDSIVETTEL